MVGVRTAQAVSKFKQGPNGDWSGTVKIQQGTGSLNKLPAIASGPIGKTIADNDLLIGNEVGGVFRVTSRKKQ